MKLNCEDILAYRCPRWEQMPGVELYIDQVVLYLHDSLSVFYQDEKNPVITATMVNNYVKQGVLPPPVRKKYGKGHLACLFVLCILKRFMSISDIGQSISGMKRTVSTGEGYNMFCDELEAALHRAFMPGSESLSLYRAEDSYEVAAMRALTASYATIVLAERIMAAGRANAIKKISEEKKSHRQERQEKREKKEKERHRDNEDARTEEKAPEAETE